MTASVGFGLGTIEQGLIQSQTLNGLNTWDFTFDKSKNNTYKFIYKGYVTSAVGTNNSIGMRLNNDANTYYSGNINGVVNSVANNQEYIGDTSWRVSGNFGVDQQIMFEVTITAYSNSRWLGIVNWNTAEVLTNNQGDNREIAVSSLSMAFSLYIAPTFNFFVVGTADLNGTMEMYIMNDILVP